MNLFACALLALCPQDPGQGLRQYQAGDFAAAAEAFRAATAARPDAADLWYDLALSEWRRGQLPAAEDAAERYASTPGGGRVDLHRGLLGNIRYSEAEALGQQAEAPPQPQPQKQPSQPAAGAAAPPAPPADPVALLEQAVAKAKAARDEFVRAAAAPTAGAEVARNTERALKLLADLEKKLEEAKKRRDEQQKQDQKNDQKDKNDKSDKDQDNKDKKDQQQKDEQKDQQKQKDQQQQQQKDQKDKKDNDQQDQQPKEGEARPEPKQPDPKEQKDKPKAQQAQQQDQQQQDHQQKDQQQQQEPKDGEARPEPKPEDGKDGKEPKPAQPRSDAPGEQQQVTELSPEQKLRLIEELQKLDGELRKLRAAARTSKKPVERDW